MREAQLSKQQWAEPHAGWLPLRQAVFKFGIADDEAAAIHDKSFKDLTDAEIEESATTPFSQRQLIKILHEQTGAHKVEIDPIKSTFSFVFSNAPFSGATAHVGTPWGILVERRESAVNPDPRLDAEALFNTEGFVFVRIGDEEVSIQKKQDQSVRRATGLVFRQLMIRAFDRAISTKTVALYARPQMVGAPFERLPADAWPLLEVADWESGVAVGPNDTVYWSIHAGPSEVEATSHDPPSQVEVPSSPQPGPAESRLEPGGDVVDTPAGSNRDGKRKRGPKIKHDWEEAILFLEQRLWPGKGDPDDYENRTDDWKSDTDVAKHVLEHMTKYEPNVEPPDLSTVSKKLRPVLARLRKK